MHPGHFKLPTPFEPCDDPPYLFVCYGHDDQQVVFPEMTWLNGCGVRQWFDRGIPFGAPHWDRKVVAQITSPDCFGVLFFMTIQSLQSNQCKIELTEAERLKKPIYIIELEEGGVRAKIRELGDVSIQNVCNTVLAQFGSYQRLIRHQWRNEAEFRTELLRSLPREVRRPDEPEDKSKRELRKDLKIGLEEEPKPPQEEEPKPPRYPVRTLEVGYFLGVKTPDQACFRSLADGEKLSGDSQFLAVINANVACHALLLIEELDSAGRHIGTTLHWPDGRLRSDVDDRPLEPGNWEAIPGHGRFLYATTPKETPTWRIGLVVTVGPIGSLLDKLDRWPGADRFPDVAEATGSKARMPDITRLYYELDGGVDAKFLTVAPSRDLWHWTSVHFQ